MSFVLQRSSGGTHVRSPGGAKNIPATNSFFQIVYGVLPVCGFGTFSTSSKFNSLSWWSPTIIGGADYTGLVFNDVWPNVFLTLTETMTAPGPYGTEITGTRVITYHQSIVDPDGLDVIMYDVSGGNGLFDVNGSQAPSNATTTVSPDGTTFQQTWTDSSGDYYEYTAVVSNQLNAKSLWPAWTDDALELMGDFPNPAMPGSFPDWSDSTVENPPFGETLTGMCAGWFIFPSTLSPLAAMLPPENSAAWSTLVMAAANGLAARISYIPGNPPWGIASGTGVSAYIPDTPVANAWVQDSPDPGAIATTNILPNCGAVICAKSRWQLLGLAQNHPALTGVTYNHLAGVWAQLMGVAQPPSFTDTLVKFGAGFGRGQTKIFTPTDVATALANVGGSAPYGILGFRPPPPVSGGAGGGKLVFSCGSGGSTSDMGGAGGSITGAGGGTPTL